LPKKRKEKEKENMKYKALALSFLLLLPVLFLAPHALGDFPPPPPPGNFQPVLWVDSPSGANGTKFYGPCKVSTNFNVDVRLWNDKTITGNDVYAYDFNLTWDTSLAFISLVGVNVHIPFSSYYIVANDTTPNPVQPKGNYHLAITSTGAGLDTAYNISLVTLTFHIDAEPSYPDKFSTVFNLTNNGMSGDGTSVIVLHPELDNSTYCLDEYPPDIHFYASDELGPINDGGPYQGDYYVTERALGATHTIEVHLSNVTNCYGFWVEVEWDYRYKRSDIQSIVIGPLFPAPYEFLNMWTGTPGGNIGQLDILVVRPWEKKTICGSDVLAFSFVLTERVPDKTQIPAPINTTIYMEEAFVLEKTPQIAGGSYEYDYNFAGPWTATWLFPWNSWPIPNIVHDYPLIYSCDMLNMWNPKRADLTLDGKVDTADLAALSPFYETVPVHWGGLAVAGDGKGDPSLVDIFDFVYVAKHFGDP
jgi:hypothetical protein